VHYLRPDHDHHHPHHRRRHHHHGAVTIGDSIPVLVGPQGYEPNVPIPVILARDEEMLATTTDTDSDETEEDLHGRRIERPQSTHTQAQTVLSNAEKPSTATGPKPPPPAYGLWRSSVRLNPGLLHWAKAPAPSAEEVRKRETIARLGNHVGGAEPTPSEGQAFGGGPGYTRMPRPPSYVSDDGVEYVVAAAPTLRGAVLGGEGGAEAGPGFEISEMGSGEVHPALREGRGGGGRGC